MKTGVFAFVLVFLIFAGLGCGTDVSPVPATEETGKSTSSFVATLTSDSFIFVVKNSFIPAIQVEGNHYLIQDLIFEAEKEGVMP